MSKGFVYTYSLPVLKIFRSLFHDQGLPDRLRPRSSQNTNLMDKLCPLPRMIIRPSFVRLRPLKRFSNDPINLFLYPLRQTGLDFFHQFDVNRKKTTFHLNLTKINLNNFVSFISYKNMVSYRCIKRDRPVQNHRLFKVSFQA